MNIIRSVSFYGGARTGKNEGDYNDAYQSAKLLAQHGLTIVDGGGPGIMFAAIQGAQEAGGKTVAVFLDPDFATTFEGKERHVKADVEYSEKNYLERTKRLMELGDAYVFFNGGTGTISELGMCWVVARLYFGDHKPLILFGEFWRPIIETIAKQMNIRADELRLLQIVHTPDELLKALEDFERMIEEDRQVFIKNPGEERCLMLGPGGTEACRIH